MPDAHDVLNLEDQEEEDELKIVDPDRSCLNCKKQNTCVVFQQVGEILHPEAWRGCGDPPIKLQDLATMCDEFEEEE